MRRGQWGELPKVGGYALGVCNLGMLVFAEPTTVSLGLAVVLAPFTLALALHLTAFLACNVVSLALGDRRERAELLVCAVAALQPPSVGEKYQEAMLAEISAVPSHLVPAMRINLLKTATRTVLAAWTQSARRLRKRVRAQKIFPAEHLT